MAELVERNLRHLIRNVPLMPAPRRDPSELIARYISVHFSVEPSDALPGYALVTGFLPFAMDPDTPVFVITKEGDAYEAFLLEDNFIGLYLPEDAQPVSVDYIWTCG